MLGYLLRRIVQAAVTFVGISVITFVVIRLAPGDPAQIQMGGARAEAGSTEQYEALRSYFGLDRPLAEQYASWLGRLVRGDFGESMRPGRRPVWGLIGERLPWTALVMGAALVVSLVAAVPTGLWTGYRAGGRVDRLISVLLAGLYAVPSYVMGMALIVVAGVRLGWLPWSGPHGGAWEEGDWWARAVDVGRHMVLITVCLAYPSFVFQARLVRSATVETLGEAYILAARARGLSESRILLRHVLPNALLPLITVVGLSLPALVGGSVILEVMFNWPGLGRLFYESVLARDYATVMGLTSLAAVVTLGAQLGADVAYGWADPRIRYERRS